MTECHLTLFAYSSTCLIFDFVLEVPIYVHGEGSYAISAVKEMKVTKDFLKLDENDRKCQNKESHTECTSKQYLDSVMRQCNCTPFALKNFTDEKKVCLMTCD